MPAPVATASHPSDELAIRRPRPWDADDRCRPTCGPVLLVLRALAVFFLVLAPLAATADEDASATAFRQQVTGWERTLASAEDYIRTGFHKTDAYQRFSAALANIVEQTRAAAAAARQDAETTGRLLAALGPPPAADQPPEQADVAARRKQLNDTLAQLKARQQNADFLTARAQEALDRLSTMLRKDLLALLFERWPSPLLPSVFVDGTQAFGSYVTRIVLAPVKWYRDLSDQQRRAIWLHWGFLFFLVAIVVGLVLRRSIMRHFGPDPAIVEPPYRRRFAAAVASAVGQGVMPAALLLAMALRVRTDTATISGLPADVLTGTCRSLILVVLIIALSAAVLRPEMPQWRLTRLTSDSARRLHRCITFLAIVFAVDQFFRYTAAGQPLSEALKSLYLFGATSLYTLAILLLIRARVWRIETSDRVPAAVPATAASTEAATGAARDPDVWWRWVRYGTGAAAVFGLLAASAGYTRLGIYLSYNLVLTGLVLAGLYLIRDLFRELIDLLASRLEQPGPAGSRSMSRFGAFKPWLATVIDPVLMIAFLYLVLPEWGLPRDQMSLMIGDFLAGFTIGGVTISIADIAVAAIVFVAVLLITRGLRRLLANRILPQTKLDLGVRNSITVGIGYLGVLLAVLLTFGVLGIGLSNVAIVAGALSVGIGFGLQNIVNNFVSGVILLVERPLKVGDWVVIGDKQGYVKKINVRATEIETFDRAALIVPNSEVLSTALINWTHRDRLGRVEVRVGVAYGTEPQKVRDILLQCAEASAEVLRWPRPFVIFVDFGPSSMDFVLYAYLRDVEKRLSVASEIRFAIDEAFRRERVEIPFAQQVVHVPELDQLGRVLFDPKGKADGNTATTDAVSLAADSQPGVPVPQPIPPAALRPVPTADEAVAGGGPTKPEATATRGGAGPLEGKR